MKRPTIILLAASSTMALLLMALFALPWVRDVSGSIPCDFTLIFCWAVAAMAAGWFQTALVMPPVDETVDAASGSAAGALKSGFTGSALFRTGLVVVAVLANLYWSNVAAGDFWFGHYSRIGTYATGLRSDDPADRAWAISRVAEMPREPVRDLVGPLARLMNDPDESVRAKAVAALGHLARRMRIAVRTLDESNEAGRWEPELLESVTSILGDPAARVREEKGNVRKAWIFAVGGTGDASAVPILESVIDDADAEVDEKVAAVEALVDIMTPEALPVLERALGSSESEVLVRAWWASGLVLRSMVSLDPGRADRDPRYRSVIARIDRLLPAVESQAACAFLELFPGIGDARVTAGLIGLSKSPSFLVRCTRIERTGWFGAPEPIVKNGRMEDLVLNAMSSVAVGNRRLEEFLVVASEDHGRTGEVRSQMKSILDQLRTRRDSSR